jgi:hypothetical protein
VNVDVGRGCDASPEHRIGAWGIHQEGRREGHYGSAEQQKHAHRFLLNVSIPKARLYRVGLKFSPFQVWFPRVIPANFVPIYSRVPEPTLRIAPLITKNEWKPNGSENLVSILEELAGLEARQFTPAARKLFAGEERRDEAPTL